MNELNTEVLENLDALLTAAKKQERYSEISLIDLAAVLLRGKWLILGTTFAAMLAAGFLVLLLPRTFKAEATIMPPQQQQSSLAALSGALGGLAGSSMASSLGLKNPGDLYIGILGSRTIADDIIQRFHLQKVYKSKRLSAARQALHRHASFSSGKDSLIKITVEDHDPKRAAEIANAFVDELYKQNSRLAITDASQRRLFFEEQLGKQKDALADAEIALKNTQQSTGMLAPTGQTEALIRSGAQLRAEIASREVQLQGMRSFATDENPQVRVLKREIEALQQQSGRLEADATPGAKLQFSMERLPQASLQYIRKLREVKYHETLFELLAKQYEAARIDEAKQAPIVQVVDPATTPDAPSGPARLVAMLACGAFALLLVSATILSRHCYPILKSWNVLDAGKNVA